LSSHPLIDKFNEPVLKNLGLENDEKLIILGPCAVESYAQLDEIAKFLTENNIKFMRAGVFKPRTSVYDFQGLGSSGLALLKEIKEKYNLKLVSEIMDISQLPLMNDIDILQVGARNMQNFELLKQLGKTNKTIILKRGFGNTIDEFLCAAEYILKGGNKNLILCERGIRTFEPLTRNTLDLGCVAIIKNQYQIPIITDPSHATGHQQLVTPLALASLAAGADGIMIEIHNNPSIALSDAEQALDLKMAKELINRIK